MADRFENVISKYVPEGSVDYCTYLWRQNKFTFKVTRDRTTKLGDYRFNPSNRGHIISVNGGLNQFSFLLTLIHEMAHMHVQLQFGRNAKPHGKEWKRIFRELMLPLLNPDIFPDEILRALAKHMRNPKASSQSDSNLVKIMRGYDVKQFIGSYLEDVVEGEQFLFNKRQFKKLQKKRTRAVCLDLHSGRKYLIAESAEVSKI